MSKRCPECKSDKFYLVVERTWSWKVSDVGLSDVSPESQLDDELAGKSLVCDDCGFNGWIDEYHLANSGVVLSLEDKDG